METERENSNQKTSILKDSSIRSIWTICVKRGLVKGKEREREIGGTGTDNERERERHTHTHRQRE